jgi:hypothetical protein
VPTYFRVWTPLLCIILFFNPEKGVGGWVFLPQMIERG